MIYQNGSNINFVVWSLEIEAQFYVLAPFLAVVLSFRCRSIRWGLVAGMAGACAAILPFMREHWPVVNLTALGQLPYLFAGFMVAGKYAAMLRTNPKPSHAWDLAAVGSWVMIAYLLLHRTLLAEVLLPFAVAVAYICILNGCISRSIFCILLATTIGGMCYTIYLYHPFLKSALKLWTFEWNVGDSYFGKATFQITVLGTIVGVCCAPIFMLLERPFTIPDWPDRASGVFRRSKRRAVLRHVWT